MDTIMTMLLERRVKSNTAENSFYWCATICLSFPYRTIFKLIQRNRVFGQIVKRGSKGGSRQRLRRLKNQLPLPVALLIMVPEEENWRADSEYPLSARVPDLMRRGHHRDVAGQQHPVQRGGTGWGRGLPAYQGGVVPCSGGEREIIVIWHRTSVCPSICPGSFLRYFYCCIYTPKGKLWQDSAHYLYSLPKAWITFSWRQILITALWKSA